MYTSFAVHLQSNKEFYHKTTILVQNKTVTAKIRGSHFHLFASFTLVQCSGAAESILITGGPGYQYVLEMITRVFGYISRF